MSSRTTLGLVLLIVGMLALAYPAITYTESEQVLDIGPLEVTSENEERIPIPPLVGGAAIVGGVVLLVLGSKRGG